MTKREAKRLAYHIAAQFLSADVDNGGLLGTLPNHGVPVDSEDYERVRLAMEALIGECARRGWSDGSERTDGVGLIDEESP